MDAVLRAEWIDLREEALQKLQCDPPDNVTQGSWDGLVLRFRKMREALTATGAPAAQRCEVYELSADVCAAAGNMAELLKCLQQLVNSIYPSLQLAQQAGAAGAAAAGAAARGQGTLPCELELLTKLQHVHISHQQQQPQQPQQQPPQRRAEASSALLLYFACVPRQPVVAELVKQLKAASRTVVGGAAASGLPAEAGGSQHRQHDRCLPPPPARQQQQQQQQQQAALLLLDTPCYQLALRAATAACAGNWVQFLRIYSAEHPPLLVRAVMGCHLRRLRVHTVHAAALAYRMLPSDVLLRWLGLQQQQQQQALQLAAVLQVAAEEGGSRGARVALEQLRSSAFTAAAAGDGAAALLPSTLQFRVAR